MTELNTKRLLLRTARASDVTALHAVFSDPQAMRFWSSLPHTELTQTEGFVHALMRTQTDFVVELDGLVIGKAGFWEPPEVGFILHPNAWRQGIGAEALEALISFGFETLGLGQITADVDPRNTASIGLLGKFGFEETGRAENTFKLGDEWCDSIYLALKNPMPQS